MLGSLNWRSNGSFVRCKCEGAVLQPRSSDNPAIILLRSNPKETATSRFILLNEKIDALAKEIRERRLAEQEAHQQGEQLRVTLASIGDAVIATDATGLVTFMNAVAESLTGWTMLQSIGRPLSEIFHVVNEHTREIVENPVAKVAQQKTIVGLHNHTVLIAKNGIERLIDDSGAPIKDAAGKLIGVVLVFRDVTERKQVEQQRERLLGLEREARAQAELASRIKDDFLATVSHELRTPLNAIMGWANLMRRSKMPLEKVYDALEIIERNAQAQSQIINDILDVSRIISGRLQVEAKLNSLIPVIDAALDAVRPASEAKEIRLQLLVDPSTGPVLGDANRLQQIVWNLLTNAIKYTPKGGLVQIQLEQVDSNVELTVKDTGIGIKRDFLPFVFDRFRQADSATTRKVGGLGLGLAIVRHLVELQGGTVSAESEGEGQGATFKVRFPIAVVTGNFSQSPAELFREKEQPEQSPYEANLSGLRILAIDDEPDARALLEAVLSQCGADVKTAASSEEGLEIIKGWRPNVIVSDIGMPEEDGYRFIRRVRALPPEEGGDTPAAALTAYARAEDRLRVLSSGYQTHLPKPIEPAELAAAVASLAKRSGRR